MEVTIQPEQYYLLALSTCPNQMTAEKIAHLLVSQRLAACVNVIPHITSIYRWHNSIEKTQEYLLLIKTNRTCYPSLEKAIREQHPYETAEIIAIPIDQGASDYLQWLQSSLS